MEDRIRPEDCPAKMEVWFFRVLLGVLLSWVLLAAWGVPWWWLGMMMMVEGMGLTGLWRKEATKRKIVRALRRSNAKYTR